MCMSINTERQQAGLGDYMCCLASLLVSWQHHAEQLQHSRQPLLFAGDD